MSRAAAAALVLLALLLQPRAVVPFAPEGLELTLAERLLHGLPGPFVSMNLPMQSVVTGLVFGHGPSWLALWAPELLHAATVVLTFTLGALLHSLLAGGAAAALLAAAVPFLGFDFMSFYAVLVLLSANALAWAADREQARRTSWPGYLATGLALGLTLLQRSPLFLLPFLLAGHLWLRRRSRGEPPPVREALALIAPPVLLLLPWMRLNWLCFGVPSPFELGRARFNIVTGALGRVTTLEGVLVGAGPASGESAVLWAAARVLAHPLDFLLAAALRLKAVLSWQPWLAGLAAVSAWTMRGRLPHRQVAVLAAYFLGIHCLMPVKPFYFTALWPVAAALAGAALAAPFRAEEGAGRRACAGAAGLGLAAASVLGLFTLSVVWAYPGRAAAPSRLEAEARRRPELPCLRTEYGRDLLRRGRVDDAVAQLRAAGRAGPRRDRELDLAWALLARGSGGADLIDRVDLSAGSWEGAVRGGVLRALGALQRGRVPAAAAAFAEAELRYSARYAPAPGATEADREAQRALALSDPGLAAIVLELLRAWPEPRRGALLARFRGEVLPAFASVRFPSQAELHEDGLKARIEEALARAAAEAKKDRRAEALASLALVERLSPDDRALERVVVAYRSLGEFSRALAVLKKTGRGGPRDAGALLDLSAEAARSSRAAEALEILACVEGPGLGRNDRRRLASAYRGLGEYAFALTVLKRARLDGPLDPAMLLDLAAEAAKSGRTAERLAILSFAESLPLSPESARRLAFAYRDAGAYSLSLSVLRKAGLDGPRGAGALLDLGVRAAAAGRRDAALASLAAAERASADPVFLRRLAAAYRDAGDSRAAGRVRRRAGDDAGLLLDRAEAAAAAGDRRGAAALLSRAASLGLDDDEARRVVLLRQSQGDYAGAAEVARARIVLRPVDARWRNDLGVLHSLMGRDDEAAADWAAAIALDPDGLAPYLSLGTLYSSAGRRRDALELYEKSLSRRHVPSEAGVLRRILEERRKLLP